MAYNKIGKWNQEMLDGIKGGDIDRISTAVDNGAKCQLGISFMFKIFKYMKPDISVPIITMLRDKANEIDETKFQPRSSSTVKPNPNW